jgi:murein DD-endopeptidase MepM/ murein hydrolase activator NlpD
VALASLSCSLPAAAPALRPEPAPSSAQAPARSDAAPPPAVTTHTVQQGETLWRIARAYGADLDEVIAVNGLEASARIRVGQTLTIPNPHRLPPPGPLVAEQVSPPSEPSPAPDARVFWEEEEGGEAAPRESRRHRDGEPGEAPAVLHWPLYGAVHSGFGQRGRWHHDGVDIDARRGDPIHAAAGGTVVFSGSRGAYGKTVVVDHGGGVSTLYAHADALKARQGARVRAGQTIARAGRTGNAHGCHLHFEVRINGRPVDPLEHLPLQSARAGAAR